MAYDHPDLYPNLPASETVRHYPRLKPAEKVFVDAYIAHMGTSAKAAGKAITDVLQLDGVDNSERANKMLRLPQVRQAIHERARQIAAKFDVDANSVIKEVANIAFSNMSNYLHITSDGDPYIDLSGCDFNQLAAIQEVTVEDFTEGRGDDARDVKRIKIKLHPKLEALEKLMKYLQMYAPERIDVNVHTENINVNMSAQEAAELYASSLRKVGG